MPRAVLLLALLWGSPLGDINCVSAAKWINSYAGPFIAVLERWTDCPNTRSENLVHIHLKASQFRNRQIDSQKSLQTLTGNITLDIPLTNKGSMYMKASSRSNNEWKENAHVLKFNHGICKAMVDNMPDFTRQIYKLDPDQLRHNCVIPKGTYLAENVPVNFTVPKLPVFPYGTWRTEIGYDLGTDAKPRNIMCFQVDIYTVPKL